MRKPSEKPKSATSELPKPLLGGRFLLTLALSTFLVSCAGERAEYRIAPAAPVLTDKPNIDSPVRQFAQQGQGSFACGLYLQGKKIGYLVGTSRIVRKGETDFFEQKMETLFSTTKRGKPFIDKSTLTRTFNLDANGELVSIEQINDRDGSQYRNLVIKQGDNFLETSTGGKSTKSITVESPKTSLDNDKQLSDWLASSPKAGDTFEYKSSDFNGGEFNEHTSNYKYIARQERVINGVATTIHTLEMTDDRDSEVTQYDCDAKGRLIRGNLGPVTFRLEEESTARNLGTPGVDLIEASSVATNVRMGDPTKLKQVMLKISGINYDLPNSHRQMQMGEKKGGWTTLILTRDFKSADKEVLNKEELQKYLRPTPRIQSDSAEIKAFAKNAIGTETDTLKKASLLQEEVFNLIGKDVNRNSNTSMEVLERKAGDCTEHALLFNALARSVGIPTREVSGLMYTQSPEPQFYWHVWNEIHDGQKWISLDPTWNEVGVDAGHLKIANEDTIKIANSFGNMKIEIVSFQTSDAIPTKGAFIEPKKDEQEQSVLMMNTVPPPPASLHSTLKEPPPPVNYMIDETVLNQHAKPPEKTSEKKNLSKPIEQFHGGKLQQVQFDTEGHPVN